MKERTPSLTPEEKTARRLRARHRFQAIVRLAIQNLKWLDEDEEEDIGDDVKKNIHMFTHKKSKKAVLTIKEKAILNKRKEHRTEEDKQYLNKVIGGMKCFRRYPSNVKGQLAAVTYFCFYGPGRTVVKQYQKPRAMYFMMSGEASVNVRRFDTVLQEWVEEVTGTISAGSMFGEVSLLHGIDRLSTITTLTPCEFLMIQKEDFDLVLKDTVLMAWEQIQKIMNKYTYFKNWDIVTKRECSIVSRTRSYVPQETILGDEYGIKNCVYFVTEGSCHIIEHIYLLENYDRGVRTYKVHIPKETKTKQNDDDASISIILKKYLTDTATQGNSEENVADEEAQEGSQKSSTSVNANVPSNSTIFSCMPSEELDLETHFIRVCELTEGACFNIGESFARRRVVATAHTKCLLIPRYWLMRNNTNNIWGLVQHYLNQHIPSTEKIFKRYIEEKKFVQYRKNLIRDLLRQKKISSNNSIHNVPFSIRIREGVDVNYHL